MTEIIKGQPLRFDVNIDIDGTPKSIDDLAGLEYWVYTYANDIKKFSRDGKTGYIQMTRIDEFNYYFDLLGSDTKDMSDGTLKYDIYYAETDTTISTGVWEPLKSVTTDLYLKYSAITDR